MQYLFWLATLSIALVFHGWGMESLKLQEKDVTCDTYYVKVLDSNDLHYLKKEYANYLPLAKKILDSGMMGGWQRPLNLNCSSLAYTKLINLIETCRIEEDPSFVVMDCRAAQALEPESFEDLVDLFKFVSHLNSDLIKQLIAPEIHHRLAITINKMALVKYKQKLKELNSSDLPFISTSKQKYVFSDSVCWSFQDTLPIPAIKQLLITPNYLIGVNRRHLNFIDLHSKKFIKAVSLFGEILISPAKKWIIAVDQTDNLAVPIEELSTNKNDFMHRQCCLQLKDPLYNSEKESASINYCIDDEGRYIAQARDLFLLFEALDDKPVKRFETKLEKKVVVGLLNNYVLLQHQTGIDSYAISGSNIGKVECMKHSQLKGWTASGLLLVTFGNGRIKVWNLAENKELIAKVLHSGVIDSAINEVTGCLATASKQDIKLWDIRTGECTATRKLRFNKIPQTLTFGLKGDQLIVAYDKELEFFDLCSLEVDTQIDKVDRLIKKINWSN